MKAKPHRNSRTIQRLLLAALLTIFAFFEFLYLFGSLDGTCYAFCVTFYNLPCLVFSVGMFIFGLASVIAWFPRYEKLFMASLSTYFGVTLLAFLCWAPWVPILAFASLVLSLIAFGLSGNGVTQPGGEAERLSFGLALSTFLVFAIDGVISCIDFTPESASCALLLLGLLSIPLRTKRPRYSSIPLLLYFFLYIVFLGSSGARSFALFGLGISVLALVFAFRDINDDDGVGDKRG
ncbi:hypothetical protein [Thermococcus camini]|uniref:Uncharacterized protein n=1 Tax=Thermococcus camini TaxID=2016373 RepID=A0A7G2DE75_9EURY|nr:hypothetical protein [Thermococcus camini]CAD5245314.1 conserved membrane protein of unknown function [Thermococcus camini]